MARASANLLTVKPPAVSSSSSSLSSAAVASLSSAAVASLSSSHDLERNGPVSTSSAQAKDKQKTGKPAKARAIGNADAGSVGSNDSSSTNPSIYGAPYLFPATPPVFPGRGEGPANLNRASVASIIDSLSVTCSMDSLNNKLLLAPMVRSYQDVRGELIRRNKEMLAIASQLTTTGPLLPPKAQRVRLSRAKRNKATVIEVDLKSGKSSRTKVGFDSGERVSTADSVLSLGSRMPESFDGNGGDIDNEGGEGESSMYGGSIDECEYYDEYLAAEEAAAT